MIGGQSVKQLYESLGPFECSARLQEGLEKGLWRPEDFSIRELAEAFCGPDWVKALNPRSLERYSQRSLLEAGEGVDVAAFSHITGQIIYSKIQQGWEQIGFIGEKLFLRVPTEFEQEKIPGIGRITGDGEPIRPGGNYPEIGFGEQYWQTPVTTKHGMIVSLTKEAIFFDRTGLITRRAGEAGSRLRYNKEKRQLAVVAGITVPLGGNETFNGNNHQWKGTSYNTYATTANAIGINSVGSLPLTDWTAVNTAIQLFVQLLDPDTGLPILINPTTLIVMPQNLMNARRIVRATQVRSTSPGYATSGIPQQFIADSPIDDYDIVSSPLLRQLIVQSGVSAAAADQWWFLCEPDKCFWYMENWPLTVVQSPANSIKEFEQDIVLRWKASERGVPFMADPRYATKLYNT